MSFSAPLAAHPRRASCAGRARAESPEAGRSPGPRRHLFGTLSLLYVLLFICPSLSAGQITVDGRIGYQGTFQLGRPFPVEVEIINHERAVEGWAEVSYWKAGTAKGGTPYAVRSRREVFISAGSRKSVTFTVDPDFVSRPLTVSFSSPAGLASRDMDLRRHFSQAPVMLLLTQGSNAVPRATLPGSLQQRLLAVSLSDLPADPRAWLGVSHLILYEQSFRELSSPQLGALDTWLVAGGRLVVLGSLNYALYREPALSRFLPVRVSGARRIAWVPSLDGQASGAALNDVWAQVATLNGGRALLEAHGLPLVAEAARGKGRVVYCALDIGRPPLNGWDGLPALWRMLLAAPGTEDTAPRTRWDEAVFSQLVIDPSFAAAYVPTRSLFLALLVYLGGVAAFGWAWQRERRAPAGLLPVFFIIYVVSSAAAGYAFFGRGGNIPDGVLLAATVLENSAGGYAEAQTNLAVFSTQIRSYSLELERGWLDLTPVSSQSHDRSQPVVILQDGVSSRYQLPLREWDYRLFRMRSIARFDVRAQLEYRGDRLLIDIDNSSGKDLIGCWLLLPGQKHVLGEIPNGARLNRIVPAGQTGVEASGGRPAALDFRDVALPDRLGEILFHNSFFSRHADTAQWSGSALFFGWVRNPDRSARIDDPRMRVHEYALFRALVPLAGPEDE